MAPGVLVETIMQGLGCFLWLARSARAGCTPMAMEQRPGPAPGTIVQILGWTLDDRWPNCPVFQYSPLSGRLLLGVDIRVTDADGRQRELAVEPRLTWAGTADEPTLRLDIPELRPGGRLELALTQRSEEVPAAPRPPADPPQTGMVSLLPRRKPLRALARDNEATTAWLVLREGALPAIQTRPPAARAAFCQLLDEGRDCEPHGPWAWSLPERGRVRAGWLLDRVEPSGSLDLAPGQTVHWALPEAGAVLEGPRGLWQEETPAQGPWGLGEAFEGPLPPEWSELLARSAALGRRLSARNPGEATARLLFRLESFEDRPVLPDQRTAEQLVAVQALRASIPEPSLPPELRGFRLDPAEPPGSTVALVKALLDERLHPGSLPGRPPLSPRPLMKVLRSGWATPWEQALVLARALRQVRIDALPLPIRPASLGPPDPASLADWPEALVLVRHPSGSLLVDPGCRSCAPGQIRPRFDQAWVLHSEIERLPAMTPALLRRELRNDEVRIELSGPAALALREVVVHFAPEQRGEVLREMMLGAAGRLVDHQGLVQAEERLRLRFEGRSALPFAEFCLLFGPIRGRCEEIDAEGRRLEIDVQVLEPGTAAFVRGQAASSPPPPAERGP